MLATTSPFYTGGHVYMNERPIKIHALTHVPNKLAFYQTSNDLAHDLHFMGLLVRHNSFHGQDSDLCRPILIQDLATIE